MAEKNTTQRELTCICCPVGCALTVTIEGDNSVTVTGNRCPRGAAYGEKEVTNPTRIVTSTVRVEGYPDTVVSVKTASDIPKGRIDDCMKALADVTAAAPIHVGDVIVENVADTGVNIVATRSFRASKSLFSITVSFSLRFASQMMVKVLRMSKGWQP